ncbi:amidase [Rhizobium sp. RU36D]|uniref:amidase n=1 Tax=Rhizobium sp. RU36D TaxID=1907415 RepID=UPI0009D8CC23|nr:amidase [Rhizobium sp. RU36D]SMC52432.1 amidase [Rhizobium sp. RU36D]
MHDITSLSALDLSQAIHRREVSCEAVMAGFIERIDRINPLVNAIVSRRETEELVAAARTADQELDQGHSRGWLHGMPMAIKDLSNAKGLPTSQGSPNYAGVVAEEDDIHVARLRAAGAIFIGKTNTPEMGLGSHTYNSVFGVTRNPHDLSRSAGGSSGGAAAALATHMLPIADGSDMMGSLRNPASFNGVVGFRPSFGRVPDPGQELFLGQLSVAGPMGRTVADVHALLQVQAGYDPRCPLSLPAGDMAMASDKPVFAKGRIGWLGDYNGYLPFDPEVIEICAKSLTTFETMGLAVETVPSGFDMDALWRAWRVLRHFLVAGGQRADYADESRRARMKPEAIWEVENGAPLMASDIYAASLTRSDWYRYMLGLFERYDFLVLPSAQVLPFDAGLSWPKVVGGRSMDTYHRWMEVVIGPTMAGLPVAAMPAGVSATGLPCGIQIIGPPRADIDTLRAASRFEAAHGPVRPALDQQIIAALGSMG